MRLTIDHIAGIAHADIDIDGITVIAGKNDTGKSTVGRVLWSLFAGYHQLPQQILTNRLTSVRRSIESMPSVDPSFFHALLGPNPDGDERFSRMRAENAAVARQLVSERHTICSLAAPQEHIVTRLQEAFSLNDPVDNPTEVASRIVASLRTTDEQITCELLRARFAAEFDGQVGNVDLLGNDPETQHGQASLVVHKTPFSIRLADNDVVEASGPPLSLQTQAIYLDDPGALERAGARASTSLDHRHQLSTLLSQAIAQQASGGNAVDAVVARNKMRDLLGVLGRAVDGTVSQASEGSRIVYRRGGHQDLSVHNISAGMRVLATLKTLLEGEQLSEGGTVILDEPEVHLHPDWQLICAEFIVLLLRDYHMHILLTTHSPYFLRAIEVYSERHGVAERCHYYEALRSPEGNTFEEATGRTDELYASLAQAFLTLREG